MNATTSSQVRRKPVQSPVSLVHHSSSETPPTANNDKPLQDADVQDLGSTASAGERRGLTDREELLPHGQHSLPSDTDSSEKHHRQKHQARRESGVLRYYKRVSSQTWLWECLSCIAVLGLSCAIIAVLSVYNKKPLPQLPFGISLNAVVSLLATALKATLIIPTAACISQLKWAWYRRSHSLSDVSTYDDASRGPYGAVILLFSSCVPGLATVGAILTILAVALDPFTQQIIRYRPCSFTYPNSTAAVLRARSYNNSGGLATTGSQGYMQTMDIDMEAAIMQGAYGAPSNGIDLLSRCETGNCSFVEEADIAYQSLGICHRCEEVSLSIITFCLNGTLPGDIDDQRCNYTLPLQANRTSQFIRKNNESSGFWPATELNDSSLIGPAIQLSEYGEGALVLSVMSENTREQLYAEPGSYSGDTSPHPYPGILLIDTDSVGKFAYLSSSFYPNETIGGDDGPINNYPIAVECGLYPCIESYSTRVRNGLLSEKLVHQQYLHWPNLPGVDLVAAASPCVAAGESIDTSDIHISYNITVDALGVESGFDPDFVGVSDANRQCLYGFSGASLSAMTWFFVNMFEGSFYYSSAYDSSNTSPPWLSMLWRAGANNVNTTRATIGNIATSMTNHIRLNALSGEPALGQVWWSETCVEVEWAWLTLHVVLVVLCILFLALTMLVSSKHTKGRLWKSSALAMLYHGLDEAMAEKLGTVDAVDEMEERARSMRVHAAYTDRGWRFVESIG